MGRSTGQRASPTGATLTAVVRFLPHAREELTASAEWYEARRPGLGVEFLAEIDEAVGQISEHPEAGRSGARIAVTENAFSIVFLTLFSS